MSCSDSPILPMVLSDENSLIVVRENSFANSTDLTSCTSSPKLLNQTASDINVCDACNPPGGDTEKPVAHRQREKSTNCGLSVHVDVGTETLPQLSRSRGDARATTMCSSDMQRPTVIEHDPSPSQRQLSVIITPLAASNPLVSSGSSGTVSTASSTSQSHSNASVVLPLVNASSAILTEVDELKRIIESYDRSTAEDAVILIAQLQARFERKTMPIAERLKEERDHVSQTWCCSRSEETLLKRRTSDQAMPVSPSSLTPTPSLASGVHKSSDFSLAVALQQGSCKGTPRECRRRLKPQQQQPSSSGVSPHQSTAVELEVSGCFSADGVAMDSVASCSTNSDAHDPSLSFQFDDDDDISAEALTRSAPREDAGRLS